MTDPSSQPFLMPIEHALAIPGREFTMSGHIESGAIRVGDIVEVVGRRSKASFTVVGIGAGLRQLERAQAGDSVDVMLRGATREDIGRGDVLASPGTIGSHTRFSADIHLRSKEEGGRHLPILPGPYRPQYRFRDQSITGSTRFPDAADLIWPGSDVSVEVELLVPAAMNIGQRFTIHEGTRTDRMVGTGVVVAISG